MSRKTERPSGAGKPPDVGLGILLREADHAFNRLLRAMLAEHGVSFGQFQHLRHLWEEDGLAQIELSRRIGIEKASSTAVLDSLDRAALVCRERDADDRRKVRVFLTPEGARLQAPLWECARRANRIASAGLPAEDIAAIFDILERVIGNLRAEGNVRSLPQATR